MARRLRVLNDKGEPKNRGGRPKTQLNYDLISRLASIMCTREEIADVLGVSKSTLDRDEKFRLVYKEARARGQRSLRRAQFEAAVTGDVKMLIWLGKHYLDQKENSVPVAEEVTRIVREVVDVGPRHKDS